jgi:hypothetical protein
MILDGSSLSAPEADSSIRPDGLKIRAKAWSSDIETSGPPDLDIELSEFTDPGGEATFFRISGGDVDDELIVQ